MIAKNPQLKARGGAPTGGTPDVLAPVLGFNAEAQYVSNNGAHAFVAPGRNDLRGPCPGLNAMANHGYFPHHGVGTIADFVKGTYDVFGMGVDLSGFLGVYGAIFDGNLLTYSIGGPDPALVSNILLGEPQGLSGSHNKYEGDVSPTRGDLFQYGNGYKVQLKQFKELYELGMADDNYDLTLLTKYRAERFQQSLSENPYFFNAPFSGIIASPAAWSFVYRFMANKSEEYPQGQLNGEVLKSFYSITGDYPDFTYTEGHEKIPDNWYTRARGDEYTIPFYAQDVLVMALEHPEFISLGGNTGTTNSFVGIDPADLTMGVFNGPTLLEGNNLVCYGIQASFMQAPDILSGLYSDTDAAADALGTAINKATSALGCPTLNAIDKGQFNKYPGYTKIKSIGYY